MPPMIAPMMLFFMTVSQLIVCVLGDFCGAGAFFESISEAHCFEFSRVHSSSSSEP